MEALGNVSIDDAVSKGRGVDKGIYHFSKGLKMWDAPSELLGTL